MNEIRFNSFEPKQPNEPSVEQVNKPPRLKSSLSSIVKSVFKFVLVLVLLGALVLGGIYLYDKYLSGESNGVYSAVFLSNGQVYFGKIKDNNSKEIILDNVFYLQSGNQSAVSGQSIQGSQFTLVKLGNELHGPTDELFINKQNVLFYEYLRSDSQVVQSIKNYKL